MSAQWSLTGQNIARTAHFGSDDPEQAFCQSNAHVPELVEDHRTFLWATDRVLAPFHGDWSLLRTEVAPFEMSRSFDSGCADETITVPPIYAVCQQGASYE